MRGKVQIFVVQDLQRHGDSLFGFRRTPIQLGLQYGLVTGVELTSIVYRSELGMYYEMLERGQRVKLELDQLYQHEREIEIAGRTYGFAFTLRSFLPQIEMSSAFLLDTRQTEDTPQMLGDMIVYGRLYYEEIPRVRH